MILHGRENPAFSTQVLAQHVCSIKFVFIYSTFGSYCWQKLNWQFSLFTFETKCSGLKECNILYECRFILKNKVAYLCLALVIFNFKYFTGFDIERTLLQIVSKHISQTAFPSRLRVSESQTDLETTRHRSYRAEKKKIRLGVLKYSTFNDTMGLMGFVP